MATVYSGEGTCGGSSSRKWRVVLDYNTTSYTTYVSISWTATIQMKSAAQYGVALSCEGKSTTGYISSSSSSWKYVCSISGTSTVNRGTTSTSKTITATGKGQTVSGYGGADGSLSASATISIDPLPSYTVSYNANGGSGAPSSQTKYYGQTLYLSSTKPTRSGYKFIGWATSASATSATYSAGGAYTANSGTTLYAVWSADATCTLTFNANGGTNPPADVAHVINKSTTLPSAVPTREGYYFIGWATKSTATTATYMAGSKYTNNNFTNGTTITFYAVWRILRQLFFKVPEGSNVQSIYIKVPEGQSLSTLYFKVEPTYLVTSDGYYLTDSNGNYLTVIP